MFAAVTSNPPTEAKACVPPRTNSFVRLSGNNSANQVMAATNSTQTPTNVVQRKSKNHQRLVL